MAEDQEEISPVDVEKEDEEPYQPPPERSIDELLQADQVGGVGGLVVVSVGAGCGAEYSHSVAGGRVSAEVQGCSAG